jgi:hypothetical protein
VVPASGGASVNITNDARADTSPTYSPDSKTIAYSSQDTTGFYEIFTIPANGGVAARVTNSSNVHKNYPDYSPDGSKIAYSAYDGSDNEIYTVSTSGGTSTNITNNARDDQYPSYSPDGSKIVLYGFDGSVDNEIYVVPASGGTRIELTDNTNDDFFPDWGATAGDPDGTAPETTINSGPSGSTNDNTPTFSFSGSDNVTSASNLLYSYRIDNNQWSSYSSATSTTLGGTAGLADGEHNLYVKAKDQAGNEDLSPAQRTFTVDTAVPGAPTIDTGLLYDNDGNFTVSGSAESDDTIKIYDEAKREAGTGTVAEGRWSVSLNGVTEGSHTYTAKTTDPLATHQGLRTF